MPEKLEKELKKKAKKLFGSTKSTKSKAYIYGTLRKSGWKPTRNK